MKFRHLWTFLILVFLIFLTPSLAGGGEGKKKEKDTLSGNCTKVWRFSFENQPPLNKKGDFNFCYEHSPRTCCSRQHTNKIKQIISELEESEYSAECIHQATNILCSVCDADLGIGLKEGICQPMCHRFYEACKDELFSGLHDGSLDFCLPDSIVCAPLNAITSDSQEFCSKIGFFQGEKNSCYDGTPSAIIKGEAPEQMPSKKQKRDKIAKDKRRQKRKAQGESPNRFETEEYDDDDPSIDWSLWDTISFYWRRSKVLFEYLGYVSLVIVVTLLVSCIETYCKQKRNQNRHKKFIEQMKKWREEKFIKKTQKNSNKKSPKRKNRISKLN